MNINIGVMAGTPIDTKFGVEIVKPYARHIVSLPVSQNPEEQTRFQTMDSMLREEKIKEMIHNTMPMDCLVVYCNSLSSVIDFESLSKVFNIPIITPLEFYTEISSQYQRFGVFSANAQGSAGVEKYLLVNNRDAKIFSVANLNWVNAIEEGVTAEKIYNEFGLKESIQLLETIGAQSIVLGCTHFPYFKSYIEQQTELIVLSPDDYIKNKLIHIK